MGKKGLTTKIIHTPYSKEDPHGALEMPVYINSAYGFQSSEDLAMAFQGKKPAHVYTRSSNPTVEYFEQRVKSMTDSLSVIACASGMAAITNFILTICKAGDNIIASKHLFGNTYSLFDATLRPFGLEFKFAGDTSPETIEKLIDTNTRAIFLETVTNPQLEVPNILTISAIAQRHKIILAVDTTLTPPNLFNSKANGVDVEIISSTKYISGGGTSIGGLIIDNGTFDWSLNEKLSALSKQYGNMAFTIKLRREVYRNTGACLSPQAAQLQSLGLETLVLRVNRSVDNTFEVAAWLNKHKKVKSVNYPGLPNSQYHNLCKKQFFGNPGGLLTLDLESEQQCFKFMNSLSLIKRATNLNDNKTLIIHPFSTIYCEFPPEVRLDLGVRDTMMRLSVGIEDVQDIIDDLDQALSQI